MRAESHSPSIFQLHLQLDGLGEVAVGRVVGLTTNVVERASVDLSWPRSILGIWDVESLSSDTAERPFVYAMCVHATTGHLIVPPPHYCPPQYDIKAKLQTPTSVLHSLASQASV